MADRPSIEYELRKFVGARLDPYRAPAFVAPTAQLRRLGFGLPDYEALEVFVQEAWGVPITINTDCTTIAIADAVREALNRRNAA